MPNVELTAATTLPADGLAGLLIGRVWRPDAGGPSVVVARDGALFDIASAFPTTRDLCETADPAAAARALPASVSAASTKSSPTRLRTGAILGDHG